MAYNSSDTKANNFSNMLAVKSACFLCESVDISIIDIWIMRPATWEEVCFHRKHRSN